MRLVSYNVGQFLGHKSIKDYFKYPLRFLWGNRKEQYLNIEWTKDLKKRLKPDMMFVQEIYFKGKNKVPQIDLLKSELLQPNKTLTPFTQYSENGLHIGNWVASYSVAAFGGYPTKAVRMTKRSHLLETEVDDLSILAVHLSLCKRHRKEQLRFIEGYINHNIQRRFIVIGDFNVSKDAELHPLMKSCGLYKAPLSATYPSIKPTRFYDSVLYDNSIRMTSIQVIPESCSDHLPIVFDFELLGESL